MPENILDLGITIVLFIQNLGDWLNGPMQFFSFLGREEFFLFVIPALYWCLDTSLGLRVGVFLMLSGSLNDALKVAFHGPRPFWYDPQVRALSFESSFGFGIPSGHAQLAIPFWGTLSAALRRRWAWIAGITVIFFIGLSRLYLGEHFPSDVVIGWLLGAIILWALLKLELPVIDWLKRNHPVMQVIAALALSLLLILLGSVVRLSLTSWTLPPSWIENAARQNPNPIDPLASSGLITIAAVLFGLAAGAIVMEARGGFNPGGLWWKRVVRLPIGLAGMVLIWSVLGTIFPRGEYPSAYLLRYFRYALVGFWDAALAPMFFIYLKLATPKEN